MGNRGQVDALFFLDHNHNPVNNVAQSHDFTQERQKTRPDPHDSLVLVQAYQKGKLSGPQSAWLDVKKRRKIYWNTMDPLKTVHATTFEWRIAVARESGIIDAALASDLNKIRTRRNTVHLTLKVMMGVAYYAGLAKRTHEAMHKLIGQTKVWVAANP